MLFRSPYPDVQIPDRALTDVVLGKAHARLGDAALVDGVTGRVLTFGGLLDQVRSVAAGFAELGIRKGDVVALWSTNSPEYAVVFHAVARLGAIVMPANPVSTSRELAFQLVDAEAKLLVTTAALVDNACAAI